MNKKFIIPALVIVFCFGVYFFFLKTPLSPIPDKEIPTEGVINSAIFVCADNKSVQGIFFKDRVELSLSDGRNMLLSQAISASGARYANQDESFVFWNKGNTAFIDEKGEVTFKDCIEKIAGDESKTTIANPASENCIKVGGNLKIEKRGDGGEYGLCYFEDNRACEEWALLRGECPYGGRRTTGFDTIDQNYCAWLGGDTFAMENSVCTFKNGSTCPTIDLYNGTCSPKGI
ncbi:MAG: hypothetical protein LiPW41_663 [Parcubacteria group bacterium LiPW_41]|nr:MAG: hypothetical protein LiPW41_663 [Parcubacteria group bacterium LiPW_41]